MTLPSCSEAGIFPKILASTKKRTRWSLLCSREELAIIQRRNWRGDFCRAIEHQDNVSFQCLILTAELTSCCNISQFDRHAELCSALEHANEDVEASLRCMVLRRYMQRDAMERRHRIGRLCSQHATIPLQLETCSLCFVSDGKLAPVSA